MLFLRANILWPAGALAAVFVAVLTTMPCAVGVAWANSCVSGCHAAHSQCRIATKGSSSCDAQLRGCLQGCISRR